MRYLILSLFILSINAADDVKIPADVQTTIDKADKACAAVQAKADVEIAKVRQSLISSLTRLQESYTKKGNLDAANGIKAKLDELNKQVNDVLLANQPPIKEADMAKYMPGTWKVYKGDGSFKCFIQVEKDTIHVTEKPSGVIGTLKGNIITWNWDNGAKWILANDKNTWTATASDGLLTLEKQDK